MSILNRILSVSCFIGLFFPATEAMAQTNFDVVYVKKVELNEGGAFNILSDPPKLSGTLPSGQQIVLSVTKRAIHSCKIAAGSRIEVKTSLSVYEDTKGEQLVPTTSLTF